MSHHPHESQPSTSASGLRAHHKGRHRSSGKHNKNGRAHDRDRRRRDGHRPELQEPLLLEGERSGQDDVTEDVELEELYNLGTNADRYVEPDPELGPDGQAIEEPEVDLSAFLERQRLEDLPELSLVHSTVDDDDVDHSLTHITSNPLRGPQSRKGKIQHIEWDASLEEMQHDKNVAQAQSDLKERWRASAARQMGKTAMREHVRRQAKSLKAAPPLPPDPQLPAKLPKAEMEDFLDDLLS